MSKIEDLIAEKCPDGVDYAPLKDVCSNIIVPMRDRPKVFDGDTPWCRIEDIEGKYFNGSLSGLGVTKEVIDEMNLKVFPTGTVICSCSASIGTYAINTRPLITNQTFIGLVCGERIDNEFLRYYMETQTKYLLSQATTGTIPYISRKKFEEMRIPVPPLDIQKEIVDVLDSFAELETELETELKAELEARRKQYEYYRDQLLSFENLSAEGGQVEWVALSKICNIKGRIGFRGYTQDDFVRDEDGAISLSPGNIFENHLVFNDCKRITWEKYYESPEIMLSEGDIVLCKTGSTVGKVALVDKLPGKATLNPQLVVLKDIKCSARFLFYQLSKNDIQQKIKLLAGVGSVPNISQKLISEIMIPLPATDKQETIVDILDGFDSVCNDITSGIPAEIEARHKQYVYYRDKLLTFKEKTA